jgi:hypothetical protein
MPILRASVLMSEKKDSKLYSVIGASPGWEHRVPKVVAGVDGVTVNQLPDYLKQLGQRSRLDRFA